MLATVVCRSLGNADVNPCDEIIGSRLVLGAVIDDFLSLDCGMTVDELVIRDVGFTEENEMTVLLTFTLDFLYWEYVAVLI